MSIEQIKVADGKYQVFHERGKLWALRNGEPWSRDITGDNLIYWMMMRILELEAARAQVQGEPSWWMREADEGAEWTDTAAPLVLSGWTPLYTTPQPAQATQAEVTDAALIRELVDHIERNTCMHEETHRGGAIWEVCDSCGARWADDEGGKPEFKWPAVVEKARAILALRPERVPMTEVWIDSAMCLADAYADACFDQALNQRTEDPNPEAKREKLFEHLRHHGITAQAKKETP